MARITKEEDFIDNYKELEALIAGYIQNNPSLLEEFFEDKEVIWDIYLIMIVDFPLDVGLKIKIENDRFYCKKVIVESDSTLELRDYLNHLPLFDTFQGNSDNNKLINPGVFEQELLRDMEFEELAELFDTKEVIYLQEEDMKEVVDSWLNEVVDDV